MDFSEVDAMLADEEAMGGEPGAYRIEADGEEAADWEPVKSNVAQARFRQAAYSGDYDLLIAAGTISSSKTFGIAMLIVEMCLLYPETWALVVRAKRDVLEDNTIPDFLAVCPPALIKKFNRSTLTLILVNDSKIQFRSANEQGDKQFAWLKGKMVDILFDDECDGNGTLPGRFYLIDP